MMKTRTSAAGQLNLFGESFGGDDETESSSPNKISALEVPALKISPSDSSSDGLPPLLMLSLWQPWASLCLWTNPLDGAAEKQVETRHWQTTYRGLIAIHATKTLVPDARFAIERDRHIAAALRRHDCLPEEEKEDGETEQKSSDAKFAERRLAFGGVVGVVELIGVHPFGDSGTDWVAENFPAREKHFGNYGRDRFGWVFKNPIAFDAPIFCRGLQSLGAPRPEIRCELFRRPAALSAAV